MQHIRTLVVFLWFYVWYTVDKELSHFENIGSLLGSIVFPAAAFAGMVFAHRFLLERRRKQHGGGKPERPRFKEYCSTQLLGLPLVAAALILVELINSLIVSERQHLPLRCVLHVVGTAVALWWLMPEPKYVAQKSADGQASTGSEPEAPKS